MLPYIYIENQNAPLAFDDPRKLIVAWHADDVPNALAQMQRAHEAGDWLAGYASYELGYALEAKLHNLMPADRDTPLLCFGRFTEPDSLLARSLMHQARYQQDAADIYDLAPQWDRATYAQAFARLKDYIAAGDIYQANLTFPIHGKWEGDALGLYAKLRSKQAVKFGAILDLGEGPTILSRSPELFFNIDAQGQITTRPMKGTAARGQTALADAALRDGLAGDEKNRAENLMIVDLLRNDLSRISEVGSVKVPKLFSIETYETVHQMTSEIEAKLLSDTSITDLFKALFPCGSITGAPKIRAMEVLRELEEMPRGAYCGSIGCIAPNGQMQFNVAIRTISLFDDGRARLNVGGGIVWDSTSVSEYDEAMLKAQFSYL